MRWALNNCNLDLAQKHPNYVARIVADEGKIGRGHLDRFMELETTVPMVARSSLTSFRPNRLRTMATSSLAVSITSTGPRGDRRPHRARTGCGRQATAPGQVHGLRGGESSQHVSIRRRASLQVVQRAGTRRYNHLSGQHGISLDELMEASKQPGADPFDVLCNVAFSAPLTHAPRTGRAPAARQEGFLRALH